MPTLNEILDAVRSLPPAQLSELRREVERLDRESRAILLQTPAAEGVAYRLMHLTDPEFVDLLRRSLAIHGPSVMVHYALWTREETGAGLSLPAAYLTLKHLSGESGRRFDERKCSFSFLFTLDVERDGRTWPYLFEVRNTAGALDFSLWRLVAARDPRLEEGRLHPPFESEFGSEAIDRFVLRFAGYLIGAWKRIRNQRHQPFVQGVLKGLVVFGYCAGEVFEKEYQREED